MSSLKHPVALVGLILVAGIVASFLAVLDACEAPSKPVIQPDPDFANCEGVKNQVENGCLIEAGTRADFNDCIQRVRRSCVDGGTAK